NYTQGSGGALNIEVQGTNPATPDFDQLIVNGAVSLDGTLSVSLLNGFTPSVADSFKIIDNDGVDAVSGNFAGLPEGATFTGGVSNFSITSAGGTGNDVVLTAVPTNPYLVTNTNDSGGGSLRQAILNANAHPGTDTITFGISGGGAYTISPLSALPSITDALTIDGTTQTGQGSQPLIDLTSSTALTVAAATEIRGGWKLSGATLTVNAALTSNGLWSWTGGTVSGSSTLTANSGIDISGSALKTLDTASI